MKRIFLLVLLGCLWFPSLALAQNTLLPEASGEGYTNSKNEYNNKSDEEKKNLAVDGIYNACDYYLSKVAQAGIQETMEIASPTARNDILACSVQAGRIHLWMIPYFITYFANFLIGIAGIISVLFVLLGGFWYMTGGLTDDKEKGKKTITYALVGLAIVLLAWIIVNVIQVQVTG